MSARAIDLELEPSAYRDEHLRVQTYTYAPAQVEYPAIGETVNLHVDGRVVRVSLNLTPDEARTLANHLLQVADVCDTHIAAAQAERERADSFAEICDELSDAGDDGGYVMYGHPDVHYVPADQVAAKVAALEAAGCPRYIVLPEPGTAPDTAPRDASARTADAVAIGTETAAAP